jgi:uncharacterized protein (DUF433 family)
MEVESIGNGLYSAKMASRIARIRYQNFQAWAKANLLHPSFQVNWDKKTESIYSYYDLLLIRLVKRLRDRGFSTKVIKVALDTVSTMSGGDPLAWTRTTMVVDTNIIVAFLSEKPEWNPVASSKGTQKMEIVFFPELMEELKRELIPDTFRKIEIDPRVLSGTPVVKGTRIPTALVYSIKVAGGDPKVAYPGLTDDDVNDAVNYEESLATS